MYIFFEEVTDDGVIEHAINFDMVCRISYDISSCTPLMYVVYNTGVVQYFHISSKAVFDGIIDCLITKED